MIQFPSFFRDPSALVIKDQTAQAAQAESSVKSGLGVKQAFTHFQTKYGEAAKAVWSEQTGLPTLLYDFTSEQFDGDSREIAQNFIVEHRALLLKDEPVTNLQWLATREGGGATHNDFQQIYRGLRVYRVILTVHSNDNRVTMLNGSYIPDLDLNTTPVYQAEDAVAMARQELSESMVVESEISKPELVVYPTQKRPALCWRFIVPTLSPHADWEYLINAETNQVVEKNDLIESIDGSGLVFPDNPFVGQNLSRQPFRRLDGSGFLTGSYAKVGSFQGVNPNGTYIVRGEASSAN